MNPIIQSSPLRIELNPSRIKWLSFISKSKSYSLWLKRTKLPQIEWLNWKLSFKRWWSRAGRYFLKAITL